MRAKFIIVSILTILFVAQLSFAQSTRAGTAGAMELVLPVGARGIALGGSNLANTADLEAMYWNPAGLSLMKQSVSAMFSHMSYIADISVEYMAVGINFQGFGAVGLSLKTINFGDISHTTEDAIDGIGTYSPQFYTLGLTFSRELTDKIHVGATANFISENMMRTSASGFAITAGIQYKGLIAIKGLSVGIALKNLGPDMKYDGADLYRVADAQSTLRGDQLYKIEAAPFGLPSVLEMGLAYEYLVAEDHLLAVSGNYLNNNTSNDEYKIGLEYAFKDLLYLRGAYSMDPQEKTANYLYGPSFGVGAHFIVGIDIKAEYAYRWTQYFDANQVISVTLGF